MRTWVLSGWLLVGCAAELVELVPIDPSEPPPPVDVGPQEGALPDAGEADMAALESPAVNDDFLGPELAEAWQVLQPEVLEMTPHQGVLDVRLTERSLWYNESRGAAIYQPVVGDFRFTARVRTRRHDWERLPHRAVQLAGLMARDGASDQENYVFVVVGFDVNDLSVETKTTVNDVSHFVGPPWPDADAELRICRLGADFRLYKRRIGALEWTAAATYERPDLPAELQVGLVVYTSVHPADVAGRFEAVEFASVEDEAGCAAP